MHIVLTVRHFLRTLQSLYSRVGRFWTFFYSFKKSKQRSVVPLVKAWKIVNKISGSIDLYRRGHDFLGHTIYRAQKFFPNVDYMGI
jgi:hypothetical protein